MQPIWSGQARRTQLVRTLDDSLQDAIAIATGGWRPLSLPGHECVWATMRVCDDRRSPYGRFGFAPRSLTSLHTYPCESPPIMRSPAIPLWLRAPLQCVPLRAVGRSRGRWVRRLSPLPGGGAERPARARASGARHALGEAAGPRHHGCVLGRRHFGATWFRSSGQHPSKGVACGGLARLRSLPLSGPRSFAPPSGSVRSHHFPARLAETARRQ